MNKKEGIWFILLVLCLLLGAMAVAQDGSDDNTDDDEEVTLSPQERYHIALDLCNSVEYIEKPPSGYEAKYDVTDHVPRKKFFENVIKNCKLPVETNDLLRAFHVRYYPVQEEVLDGAGVKKFEDLSTRSEEHKRLHHLQKRTMQWVLINAIEETHGYGVDELEYDEFVRLRSIGRNPMTGTFGEYLDKLYGVARAKNKELEIRWNGLITPIETQVIEIDAYGTPMKVPPANSGEVTAIEAKDGEITFHFLSSVKKGYGRHVRYSISSDFSPETEVGQSAQPIKLPTLLSARHTVITSAEDRGVKQIRYEMEGEVFTWRIKLIEPKEEIPGIDEIKELARLIKEDAIKNGNVIGKAQGEEGEGRRTSEYTKEGLLEGIPIRLHHFEDPAYENNNELTININTNEPGYVDSGLDGYFYPSDSDQVRGVEIYSEPVPLRPAEWEKGLDRNVHEKYLETVRMLIERFDEINSLEIDIEAKESEIYGEAQMVPFDAPTQIKARGGEITLRADVVTTASAPIDVIISSALTADTTRLRGLIPTRVLDEFRSEAKVTIPITRETEPGEYEVRIIARDAAGTHTPVVKKWKIVITKDVVIAVTPTSIIHEDSAGQQTPYPTRLDENFKVERSGKITLSTQLTADGDVRARVITRDSNGGEPVRVNLDLKEDMPHVESYPFVIDPKGTDTEGFIEIEVQSLNELDEPTDAPPLTLRWTFTLEDLKPQVVVGKSRLYIFDRLKEGYKEYTESGKLPDGSTGAVGLRLPTLPNRITIWETPELAKKWKDELNTLPTEEIRENVERTFPLSNLHPLKVLKGTHKTLIFGTLKAYERYQKSRVFPEVTDYTKKVIYDSPEIEEEYNWQKALESTDPEFEEFRLLESATDLPDDVKDFQYVLGGAPIVLEKGDEITKVEILGQSIKITTKKNRRILYDKETGQFDIIYNPEYGDKIDKDKPPILRLTPQGPEKKSQGSDEWVPLEKTGDSNQELGDGWQMDWYEWLGIVVIVLLIILIIIRLRKKPHQKLEKDFETIKKLIEYKEILINKKREIIGEHRDAINDQKPVLLAIVSGGFSAKTFNEARADIKIPKAYDGLQKINTVLLSTIASAISHLDHQSIEEAEVDKRAREGLKRFHSMQEHTSHEKVQETLAKISEEFEALDEGVLRDLNATRIIFGALLALEREVEVAETICQREAQIYGNEADQPIDLILTVSAKRAYHQFEEVKARYEELESKIQRLVALVRDGEDAKEHLLTLEREARDELHELARQQRIREFKLRLAERGHVVTELHERYKDCELLFTHLASWAGGHAQNELDIEPINGPLNRVVQVFKAYAGLTWYNPFYLLWALSKRQLHGESIDRAENGFRAITENIFGYDLKMNWPPPHDHSTLIVQGSDFTGVQDKDVAIADLKQARKDAKVELLHTAKRIVREIEHHIWKVKVDKHDEQYIDNHLQSLKELRDTRSVKRLISDAEDNIQDRSDKRKRHNRLEPHDWFTLQAAKPRPKPKPAPPKRPPRTSGSPTRKRPRRPRNPPPPPPPPKPAPPPPKPALPDDWEELILDEGHGGLDHIPGLDQEAFKKGMRKAENSEDDEEGGEKENGRKRPKRDDE